MKFRSGSFLVETDFGVFYGEAWLDLKEELLGSMVRCVLGAGGIWLICEGFLLRKELLLVMLSFLDPAWDIKSRSLTV